MCIKIVFILVGLLLPNAAFGELLFKTGSTDDGFRYVIVSGTFDFNDDLTSFERLADYERPDVISFDSAGGNVMKAMELGRLIRRRGLATLQIRELECASACALAFMGGSSRYAAPGAIGVHKSSFAPSSSLNKAQAVSAVQELTAEILTYMSEMGVKASLLQLALRTEADDIRYLSREEMDHYGVITREADVRSEEINQPANTEPVLNAPSPTRSLPVAQSGIVRHPKGSVLLKSAADDKSRNLTRLINGTPVQITGSWNRWYKVSVSGHTGYMHHTWVRVDQFDGTLGLLRLIQIKSFDNIDDALTFVRLLGFPASIYLATNGWYAVTIENALSKEKALDLARALKHQGLIPTDSFVTLGNTYQVKLCCSADPSRASQSSNGFLQ